MDLGKISVLLLLIAPATLANVHHQIALKDLIAAGCLCPLPNSDYLVPELLHPINNKLDRLVVFLYNDGDGLKLYVPSKARQRLIPDLEYTIDDYLKPVTDETVNDIFYNNYNTIPIYTRIKNRGKKQKIKQPIIFNWDLKRYRPYKKNPLNILPIDDQPEDIEPYHINILPGTNSNSLPYNGNINLDTVKPYEENVEPFNILNLKPYKINKKPVIESNSLPYNLNPDNVGPYHQNVRPLELPNSTPYFLNVKPPKLSNLDLYNPNIRPIEIPNSDPYSPDIRPIDVPNLDPYSPDIRPIDVPNSDPYSPDIRPIEIPNSGPYSSDIRTIDVPSSDPYSPDIRPIDVPNLDPYSPDIRPIDVPNSDPYSPDIRPIEIPNSGPYSPDIRPIDVPKSDPYSPDIRPIDVPNSDLYYPYIKPIEIPNLHPYNLNIRPIEIPNSGPYSPDIRPIEIPNSGPYSPDIRPTEIPNSDIYYPNIRPFEIPNSDPYNLDIRPDVVNLDPYKVNVKPSVEPNILPYNGNVPRDVIRPNNLDIHPIDVVHSDPFIKPAVSPSSLPYNKGNLPVDIIRPYNPNINPIDVVDLDPQKVNIQPGIPSNSLPYNGYSPLDVIGPHDLDLNPVNVDPQILNIKPGVASNSLPYDGNSPLDVIRPNNLDINPINVVNLDPQKIKSNSVPYKNNVKPNVLIDDDGQPSDESSEEIVNIITGSYIVPQDDSSSQSDESVEFEIRPNNEHGYNNLVLKDYVTFDKWFLKQMNRFKAHKRDFSYDTKSIGKYIMQILHDNGMHVSPNGVLTDSYGKVLNVYNLNLRPILIGASMTFDKFLNKVDISNTKYLQSVLVISNEPPKVLGVIPLGKTYLPISSLSMFWKPKGLLKNDVLEKSYPQVEQLLVKPGIGGYDNKVLFKDNKLQVPAQNNLYQQSVPLGDIDNDDDSLEHISNNLVYQLANNYQNISPLNLQLSNIPKVKRKRGYPGAYIDLDSYLGHGPLYSVNNNKVQDHIGGTNNLPYINQQTYMSPRQRFLYILNKNNDLNSLNSQSIPNTIKSPKKQLSLFYNSQNSGQGNSGHQLHLNLDLERRGISDFNYLRNQPPVQQLDLPSHAGSKKSLDLLNNGLQGLGNLDFSDSISHVNQLGSQGLNTVNALLNNVHENVLGNRHADQNLYLNGNLNPSVNVLGGSDSISQIGSSQGLGLNLNLVAPNNLNLQNSLGIGRSERKNKLKDVLLPYKEVHNFDSSKIPLTSAVVTHLPGVNGNKNVDLKLINVNGELEEINGLNQDNLLQSESAHDENRCLSGNCNANLNNNIERNLEVLGNTNELQDNSLATDGKILNEGDLGTILEQEAAVDLPDKDIRTREPHDGLNDLIEGEGDDDGVYRIIGGHPATGSGTPLSNKGRSGFYF